MGGKNTHSFGNISLRSNGSRAPRKAAPAPGPAFMVKIEIDRSIPSVIGPQDVLEALKHSEFKGDSADIVIKGTTYLCKFVEPKAATYALGETPQKSANISDQQVGTLCVYPKGGAPPTAADEGKSWQSEPSYSKFRKPVPFGYEEKPLPQ